MKKSYLFTLAGAMLFSSVNLVAGDVEDAYTEARQRISPIILEMGADQNARQCGFRAGHKYTFHYSTKGYETDLVTMFGMFDCQEVAEGACGDTWGPSNADDDDDRLGDGSGWVSKETNSTTEWNYTASNDVTVDAFRHDFNVTYEIPSLRKNGDAWPEWTEETKGALVVARWYQYADSVTSGAPSITLMIGTEATRHYGFDLRRIATAISSNIDPESGADCTTTP